MAVITITDKKKKKNEFLFPAFHGNAISQFPVDPVAPSVGSCVTSQKLPLNCGINQCSGIKALSYLVMTQALLVSDAAHCTDGCDRHQLSMSN